MPGEGSARLPVMILGEAPGREEDSRGRPFVGASGKLLRSELQRAGIPLNKCYLTNSVKCWPDGTPTDEEKLVCSNTYLKEEIALFRPVYTLALGATALSCLSPGLSISEARGQLHDNWLGEGFVFPVWHPAYILRNRKKLSEWRIDLENFSALIKIDL